MKPNQIYSSGVITNNFRLERYRVQRSITFIAELTILALLLAVVVALAIVIQPASLEVKQWLKKDWLLNSYDLRP
jgi:hypothetical protein